MSNFHPPQLGLLSAANTVFYFYFVLLIGVRFVFYSFVCLRVQPNRTGYSFWGNLKTCVKPSFKRRIRGFRTCLFVLLSTYCDRSSVVSFVRSFSSKLRSARLPINDLINRC